MNKFGNEPDKQSVRPMITEHTKIDLHNLLTLLDKVFSEPECAQTDQTVHSNTCQAHPTGQPDTPEMMLTKTSNELDEQVKKEIQLDITEQDNEALRQLFRMLTALHAERPARWPILVAMIVKEFHALGNQQSATPQRGADSLSDLMIKLRALDAADKASWNDIILMIVNEFDQLGRHEDK